MVPVCQAISGTLTWSSSLTHVDAIAFTKLYDLNGFQIMAEIWARHPTFIDYWISSHGRVMRGTRNGKWIGRLLKGWTNDAGYKRVRVSDGTSKVDAYVQTLVLEAHVSARPGAIHEIQACHNDGSPANNRLDNLRWDSPDSNYDDQREHGTAAIGERNGNAKLTDHEREAIERSREHHDVLALRYHVDKSTIRRIRVEALARRAYEQRYC